MASLTELHGRSYDVKKISHEDFNHSPPFSSKGGYTMTRAEKPLMSSGPCSKSMETSTDVTNKLGTTVNSGSQVNSKISTIKDTLCFMGIKEDVAQLVIDIELKDHGALTTDAQQLFLTAENFPEDPDVLASLREKLQDQVSTKDNDCCQESVDHSAEVVVLTDPKEQLKAKVKGLAKENHKLKRRKMCRACRKVDLASSGITFLPCGHFITCETCAEKYDDCPACGKNIMGTVRTFLS